MHTLFILHCTYAYSTLHIDTLADLDHFICTAGYKYMCNSQHSVDLYVDVLLACLQCECFLMKTYGYTQLLCILLD